MTYRYTPGHHTTVTFLADFLDTVSLRDMTDTFGKPTESWEDEGNGYDGQEWTFVGPDSKVFNVYARWGCLRIGAGDHDVRDFKEWLLAQVSR